MRKLTLLELFCGTKSIGKEFKKLGWNVISVDFDNQFDPDICSDIRDLTKDNFPFSIDMIHASPPCDCFSVASIGKYWNKDHTPKLPAAQAALDVLEHTVKLINDINPTYYTIENPRGKMRRMECLQELHRDTVSYCQYGAFRQKPTDTYFLDA